MIATGNEISNLFGYQIGDWASSKCNSANGGECCLLPKVYELTCSQAEGVSLEIVSGGSVTLFPNCRQNGFPDTGSYIANFYVRPVQEMQSILYLFFIYKTIKYYASFCFSFHQMTV